MASTSLTGSLVSQAQSSLLQAQQERMVQQLKSPQAAKRAGIRIHAVEHLADAGRAVHGHRAGC